MQKRRRSLRPEAFILLTALFSACKAPPPPPPPVEGARPAGVPDIDQKVTTGPALEKHECGKEYKVEIKVSRQADCGPGYNFDDLDIRANDILSERLAKVTCAMAECSPATSWIRYKEHGCAAGPRAFSEIKASFLCRRATDPAAPAGVTGTLTATTTGTVSLPGETGALTPHKKTDVVEEVETSTAATRLACGKKVLVSVTLEESDLLGGAGMDFQMSIDRAKERARMVYDRIACATGPGMACAKQPFAVVYTNADYVAARKVVVVTVMFWIECK